MSEVATTLAAFARCSTFKVRRWSDRPVSHARGYSQRVNEAQRCIAGGMDT